ncbi:MAG: hypothetical protein WAU00_00995 [Caldilinea sp.]
MTVALSSHAPLSPIEVMQELISNLRPTSGALTPSYRRAVESDDPWDGTRAIEVTHQRMYHHASTVDINGSRFGDFVPAIGELSAQSTATDNPDYGMAALALAADNHDEQAFLAASAAIDWRRRDATDFLQAIQWALAAGAHRAAGVLALRGAESHPAADKLLTAARVLAPQTTPAAYQSADSSVALNRSWLKAHRGQYRGRWVALSNGSLLGSAATLEELTSRFGVNPQILYTRVF